MPPPPTPALQVATPPTGTWVQVDRAALERAAQLALRHPKARALLDLIIARSGRHNALVVSQRTLASLLGCSLSTTERAIRVLRDERWIEVRQIGPTGTACAYIVNDRVSWSGVRDGIRYSLFSAAVLVSDAEQPDREELGAQPLLEQIPTMYIGEQQLPVGEGLPPPSQPSLPSLEPDLPARTAVDPAALAAWSGRPRNDRFGLAKRVVALQREAGEIPLDASHLADKPEQLLAEATRLGLRY